MVTIKHTRESIAELEQERNDYKQQRDELSEKLDKECNDNYKLEGQLYDMTKQRDSLIKDVEKLREEKEYQTNQKFEHFLDNQKLQQENKALRLQADEHFELWQDVNSKYTNLTEHIRLKEENNPSEWRYKSLVEYINYLERDTDER
ncbi:MULTISPECIES: hypothetical protein [unclassified Mammaliicoccus]|uniref:hypothetical protein n=1 Tax=unclassified Mammaliicoccus TaxID=2803851 RepID=UPI001EFAA8EF|nr:MULTISPECIES: hypothetical protein [unclassified Mammaliicoccus]